MEGDVAECVTGLIGELSKYPVDVSTPFSWYFRHDFSELFFPSNGFVNRCEILTFIKPGPFQLAARLRPPDGTAVTTRLGTIKHCTTGTVCSEPWF